MAIAATLVGKGTATTSTLTTASGTTSASGSTFVYLVSFDATTTASTPTDNKSNAYTQKSTTLTTGNGDRCAMWVCENGVGGSGHVLSQNFTANPSAAGYLIEITGATASPTDIALTGTDTSTPFTISSGTLAQAAEVVVALCMSNQGVSATNTYSSSNTTILSQESNGATFWTSAVSAQVVASTASFTPSFTDTAGTAAGLLVISFKQGASTSTAAVTGPPLASMLGNKALGPLGLAGFALPRTISGSSSVQGSGSSALVFGQIGNLTAAGALAGTSALQVSQIGALTAAGALAGSSALAFGQSGTLTQPGLVGTAALVFGQTGALTATGVLAGSSALQFAQTAAVAASGALAATSALTVAQVATLTAAGTLAGSSALTFAQTAALTASGALAGSSALIFGASATADLPAGALVGSASLNFGGSSALTGFGALIGNCQIILDASGFVPSPGPAEVPAGRRIRNIYRVTIDGQVFEFRTLQEALKLLDQAKALAAKVAEDAQIWHQPVKAPPVITVSSRELRKAATETQREIKATYEQAALHAELRMLLELSRRQEEDDTLVLLM